MLIGITGKMGSGKDAAAEVLIKHFGYEKIAFADALREEVAAACWDKSCPDGIPLVLFEYILGADPSSVYAKPTPPGMRRVLQWWGSEYRRSQDVDYWVKRLDANLKPGKRYVIPDVRFLNEAQMIARHGGALWRVVRGARVGVANPDHISESFIDRIPCNLVIDNNGDLNDLLDQVLNAVKLCAVAA